MATHTSKVLAAQRRIVAQLQRQLERRQRMLRQLPQKFGCASLADFIAELRLAGQSGPGAAAKPDSQRPRKRAKLTPKVKARVKVLVARKLTGAAIARKLKISLPSVQNIKRELGLVKPRRAKK